MENSVRAHEISALLDQLPEGVTTLSLDCFDTLIWRNVNAPTDIFNDLDLSGGAMQMRMVAEKRARKALIVEKDRSEVTIDEIYAHMFERTDEATIHRHVNAELAAEKHHSFAFEPMVDLIAAAKMRGLDVIIVSDTYLHEPQLRELISSAAGERVADSINHIFCSCEYGVGKAGGLFMHVLAELGISPAKIMHLGDNCAADYDAPIKLGISAVHFEQFDSEAEERLRLEAVASTLIEKDSRRAAPVLQPHRAQISLREDGEPIARFGHDVLGPILHGFSRWIADEAEAFASKTGKTPKLLFLLRDGYLPAKAYKALYPGDADQAAMVEISRFTANAAGFTDRDAIERYLLAEAASNKQDRHAQSRRAAYCRQLLFTPKETGKLSRIGNARVFIREILKPANIQKIISRSKRFAEGLFAHLRSVGVSDGDAVMLVDLGYNGSVQNVLEPVLREGMNLDIAGRYLLLRETSLSHADKKGMIDIRHYDFSALNGLCESIAVVEQLCTVGQGSVLGYGEDGAPKRAKEDVKGQQSAMRDAAQTACLAYMKQSGSGWAKAPASWDGDAARRMAAASLTRLLFLPVVSEIDLFQNFVHDVNMGTSDTVQLIDPAAAADGLRRRGLFYTKNANRMYLPGELKQQGMPALLSMFVGRRFALDLRQSDFQGAAVSLAVVLMDQSEHVQIEIDAYPTADGYYQALIPVGASQFSAGIMVGQSCEWVQVEQAEFHQVEGFMKPGTGDGALSAEPIFEDMTEAGAGLYHCEGPNAFVLVQPPVIQNAKPMMLNFIFRPVVQRGAPALKLQKVA